MQKLSFLLTIAALIAAAPALAQNSGANSGNINTPSAQTSQGATGVPHTLYQGNSANQRISSLPPCYLGGPSAGKTLAPIFGAGGSMAGVSSNGGPGGPGWNSDPGASEPDNENSDMSDSVFGLPDPTLGGQDWGWLLN